MAMRVTRLLVVSNLLFLIGLVVSLAWLFKLHLTDLRFYRTFVVNTYRQDLIVGRGFPELSIRTTGNDTVSTDFSGSKTGLVFLFSPNSCQPCINLIFRALQHIHDNLKDSLEMPIYAISNGDQSELTKFKRAFRLTFQLGVPLESEDSDGLFVRTPVVFLVSPENRIIRCHLPLIQAEQFTSLFFVDLVYNHMPAFEINVEGFADSPLKEMHGMSLLELIKGRGVLSDPF